MFDSMKGRVRSSGMSLLAAAALSAVAVTPATADKILGGGAASSDCYVEFDVKGWDQSSQNHVTCSDCDPNCDTDGQNSPNNSCTFSVRLCVNQKNVPGCTSTSLKKVKVSGHKVTPPSASADDTCGDYSNIVVKLKNRHGKGGRVFKPKTLKVVGIGTSAGSPKNDKDTLFLTCQPQTAATCPASTTTTTTTPGATTTTTVPGGCAAGSGQLAFTVTQGTTSCGAAGLATGASAPTSGHLFSDTACTTAVANGDLGLGCLYFGGGGATNVPGGAIPDGSTSILGISGSNLVGANTGNRDTCTVSGGPGKHCINNNANPVCTSNADCGGVATSCAADANCFFGPPLPILTPPPNGALTTCVLNAVGGPDPAAQTDAGGTVNTSTGDSSVSMPLASRVYITGNTTSPCPKCISGSCTYGQHSGGACTAVGSKQTSNDCAPTLGGFQAALAVSLNPLTTGSASMTNASGSFCPSQANAGAFGLGTAQCIQQTGASPGPSVTDGQPHNANLASVFCIPATGAFAVDLVADLPGPGAFSLNGTACAKP